MITTTSRRILWLLGLCCCALLWGCQEEDATERHAPVATATAPTEDAAPAEGSSARLVVESTPPGATVLLDEEPMCLTPCRQRVQIGETLQVAVVLNSETLFRNLIAIEQREQRIDARLPSDKESGRVERVELEGDDPLLELAPDEEILFDDGMVLDDSPSLGDPIEVGAHMDVHEDEPELAPDDDEGSGAETASSFSSLGEASTQRAPLEAPDEPPPLAVDEDPDSTPDPATLSGSDAIEPDVNAQVTGPPAEATRVEGRVSVVSGRDKLSSRLMISFEGGEGAHVDTRHPAFVELKGGEVLSGEVRRCKPTRCWVILPLPAERVTLRERVAHFHRRGDAPPAAHSEPAAEAVVPEPVATHRVARIILIAPVQDAPESRTRVALSNIGARHGQRPGQRGTLEFVGSQADVVLSECEEERCYGIVHAAPDAVARSTREVVFSDVP